MAELATPTSQVLWAAADRRWTNWSESADVPRFYGWRVMAYDLGTWALRDLARATTSIGVAVVAKAREVARARGVRGRVGPDFDADQAAAGYLRQEIHLEPALLLSDVEKPRTRRGDGELRAKL